MKIHFDYSDIFDLHTSQIMGTELDSELIHKVRDIIPIVEIKWESEGKTLIEKAVEISGFKF